VLCGVVLSAGDSSRMGSPKALLPDPDGVPFIVRIVSSMRKAGLSDLVVVTGKHHDAIVEVLARSPEHVAALVVRNPDPARGQLSSLWTAMDACPPDTEAVVMTLVDVPMLAPSTIAHVVETWRRTRAPIVRPAFGTRRGHPVIFDRAVFDELRRAPVELGARAVVSAHYQEVVNVPVEDPGCVVDIDTPDEYRRAVQPDQDTSPREDGSSG
jgi:molybdenum cofactor cytidylyltransferase